MAHHIPLVVSSIIVTLVSSSSSTTASADPTTNGGGGSPYDATRNAADRDVLVHLFEWKWTDIAAECEQFLSKYAYGAVQVMPPNEHLMKVVNVTMATNGSDGGGVRVEEDVPWWVRYQPISYNMNQTRSGTLAEFADMVQRCNRVGVRIVVDVVINHMAAVGQKYPGGSPNIWTSAGSHFDSNETVETFPAVPYGKTDFNDAVCDHDIWGEDYHNNASAVRNCRLVNLLDLNTTSEEVREKMLDYLNGLIRLGVSGFRVDAAKHMWPSDLKAIFDAVENLDEKIYGPNQRPFIMQEVTDRRDQIITAEEYFETGRVTNFMYGPDLSAAIWRKRGVDFKNFSDFGGPDWPYWRSNSSAVFVNNHDSQRDGSPIVTYKDGFKYALATAYMLAWPFGYPSIMSGYYFEDKDQGPPSAGHPNWTIRSLSFVEHDQTCDRASGWVCEHRWPVIRRMALFRASTNRSPAGYVITDDHRIAFSRLQKGFFALNNDPERRWNRQFPISMPAGSYCDVISGEYDEASNRCTGEMIEVDIEGRAEINIDPGAAVAIHVGQRVSSEQPASSGGHYSIERNNALFYCVCLLICFFFTTLRRRSA